MDPAGLEPAISSLFRYLWWTLRESNSHLLVANEVCYHYTQGPGDIENPRKAGQMKCFTTKL